MRLLRSVLALDKPDEHLTAVQFAFAAVMAFGSASFWAGAVSQSWFVFLMTFLTQLYPAWRTPTAKEQPVMRIVTSLDCSESQAARTPPSA